VTSTTAAGRPLSAVSFNQGHPVSGITTWNLRLARRFADAPELGIDWRVVEVGPAARLRELEPLVPADLRGRWAFHKTRPDENRWCVARRLLRRHPWLAQADVLLPNHCDEAWLAADLLRRRPGRGPAVVGVLHSDFSRFYAFCGTGIGPLERVVAVSRRCADEYARHYPGRPPATFVPYGVPAAPAPPEPPPAPPLQLAYFGRLEAAQKRVLDLVPLAAALVARGADFELHVAGEGRDEPALRAGLGRAAPGRARFYGTLAPDKVAAFLARLHVFVSVSEFEGTSIAMLEAMGQGLAPVVTDVSGVRDAVEPGTSGWVVPVGDIPALADRLAELAREPAAAARAGRSAWEVVRARYSLEVSADGLAAVLRGATAEARPPLRVAAGHPSLGVFDKRWLPNPLTIHLRRLAKAALRRPT
jgi:glycosyltransferase involved in cell wall biosynthesis